MTVPPDPQSLPSHLRAPRTLRVRLAEHLREPQFRTTYVLLLNTATTAATGLVFWILFARLSETRAPIGLGYTIISLGTLVAILGKGGLDTALMRSVPDASREAAVRLLRFGAVLGGALA